MTRVWFVAVCCDCEPQSPKPMPFLKVAERDAWADAHRESTGHRVELGLDIDS
jgi:hypothetical protein